MEMARTWQEAWLHAESRLLIQSLDGSGNPTGPQNYIQQTVNVRVEPALHQEFYEEPGCAFRQNYSYPVGFNINIGARDLRDVAAQIRVWLADTTLRRRLLILNENAYYLGLPLSTNLADFTSNGIIIGVTTTASNKILQGDQVMLAGWTWAAGGGNVNGLATVLSVAGNTFYLVPTTCPTTSSNPTVIGTVYLWCAAQPEEIAYAHNDIRDFRGISIVKAPSQAWAGLRSNQETEMALWAETETPYVPGS